MWLREEMEVWQMIGRVAGSQMEREKEAEWRKGMGRDKRGIGEEGWAGGM